MGTLDIFQTADFKYKTFHIEGFNQTVFLSTKSAQTARHRCVLKPSQEHPFSIADCNFNPSEIASLALR